MQTPGPDLCPQVCMAVLHALSHLPVPHMLTFNPAIFIYTHKNLSSFKEDPSALSICDHATCK